MAWGSIGADLGSTCLFLCVCVCVCVVGLVWCLCGCAVHVWSVCVVCLGVVMAWLGLAWLWCGCLAAVFVVDCCFGCGQAVSTVYGVWCWQCDVDCVWLVLWAVLVCACVSVC